MKPVLLAEKPKQAQAYADALKSTSRKGGYIEAPPNEYFPEGLYITWAFGHLVELEKPSFYDPKWAKWEISSLPINPKEFVFKVSEKKVDQFKTVKKLMDQAPYLIIGTDADREGENIAWSIIKQAKADKKDIKRLWINSLEADVIQKGFASLKNGRDFYNSYIEAQTRQISDWLVGMNASQLYTLMLQSKGVKDTFSVGRVQTPTLFMIHQREKDIENFKPQPFYELVADVNHLNGNFQVKVDGKIEKKSEAIDLLKKNGLSENQTIPSEISKVHKSLEKESSPRLHTMSSIQTKANKQWKYSPANVLKHVQSLYDKKLVTYPRTDTPYITDSEFNYLKANLSGYQKLINNEFPCHQPDPQKRYVNSAKVQEHYAIIPTKTIPTESVLNGLTKEELNIYHEVIKNTISMFHEPYKFNKTVIEIQVNELIYKATGKVEVSKGWKSLYPKNTDDSKAKEETPTLPDVDEADPIQLKPILKEGKTSKPKRLTEGDLIPLMIHAGKLLEGDEQDVLKDTEGIGTEATRANIIETLKNQKYIEVKKNLVFTTPKGVILCEIVDGTLLSSPALTAKWETFLKLIGKGERTQETFLKSIYGFIDKLISEVPDKLNSKTLETSIEKKETENHLCECPNCENGFLVIKEKFYGCTRHSEGCKQTLSKKLLSKNITEAQMKKLIAKGKTDLIKGFKGKKEFDAYLTLVPDDEKGIKKYQFNFEKK